VRAVYSRARDAEKDSGDRYLGIYYGMVDAEKDSGDRYRGINYVMKDEAVAKIAAAVSPTAANNVDSAVQNEYPRIAFGTGMLCGSHTVSKDIMQSKATVAHHFSHRFARVKYSLIDKMIYHEGVLIEWDHGRFCTVVELGFCRGITGYNGKSHWVDDKNAKRSMLMDAVPDCMKGPYVCNKSELRMTDMLVKNVDEFKAYLDYYDTRFVDPVIRESAKVRLQWNTLRDIYKALLKYDRHNQGEPGTESYTELSMTGDARNCQTFAADFYKYLTGHKTTPLLAVLKPMYTRHEDFFLYDYEE